MYKCRVANNWLATFSLNDCKTRNEIANIILRLRQNVCV